MIPSLLVAAPASGAGKTTVVCALAAALRARGLDVRCFKAGPDYLDPSWHTRVTGRPSRNLDGWMTGREGVHRSFARGALGGDLALIEGVMGLFDGRDPRGLEGSGAELARWLDIPVLLVVDAAGMARTAAAVVAGLAAFEEGVRVAGVIFNRAPHGALLREAMRAVPAVEVVGALRTEEGCRIPERHLGLLDAGVAQLEGWEDGLRRLANGIDLDAVIRLARPARAPTMTFPLPPPRVRIGVARDEAFHFLYEENLDLLREAGAELLFFSPLHDETPPPVDGLFIGGGYPEAHREALTANTRMREAIRRFPGPVYAECGGLMYLGEELDGVPMCARLPLRTRMTTTRRSLGYREVRTTAPTLLGPAGTVFRGHEFHYSELALNPLSPFYEIEGRQVRGVEGWGDANTLASYVHAHFGSNPDLAPALVAACERSRP